MAKITPAISSRMPAVNSRRADNDNCSILGIPFCAKIVLHPVDFPGTNCNVPQGLSHCSGRHWCIQRHQKQCRPHLVGNIVFRHTTAFFLLPSCGSYILGDNQLSILFIAVLYILFVRLWEARHTELQPIPALHEWALPSDE